MPTDILIVLGAVSFLIVIHEIGHFLAARFFGVWVEEFGIGIPPRLFGKKIGQTLYSVNLLPMGGFVKTHGEEAESFKEAKIKRPRGAFFKKPWWQKSIILSAGVIMNFLFAVAVISYLFVKGVSLPDKVEIKEVKGNSPAYEAGFQSKDIISKIDGIEVNEILEVTKLISERLDKETTFELTRATNGTFETFTIKATPRKTPPVGEGALGVVLSQRVIIKSYPWYTAPYYGLKSSIEMSILLTKSIVGVFWDFLSGFRVPADVAGPIGMYQLYGEARKYGFTAVLELSGLISLNLAVINLFPIPPLDGSRLLFVLVEKATGKKLKKEWELRIYQISFIFLIGLFILISIQDIRRLFGL